MQRLAGTADQNTSAMTPSTLLSVVQVAISAAAALTAFSLWHSGLYRRYPVLFVYMAFASLDGLAPALMNLKSMAYYWTWVYARPIQWLLETLVVRELCQVVLEKHSGLATLGRWTMYIGVAVAVLLSFLSLLPHIDSAIPLRSKILFFWTAAGRGIALSLAIFLLLMLFAVSRYPVRLCRNVILNAFLFTVCFLCESMSAILKTIFDRRMNPWMVVALQAVQAILFVLWCLGLSREGEQARFDWIRFDPKYEKRVLSRLDALNAVLRNA